MADFLGHQKSQNKLQPSSSHSKGSQILAFLRGKGKSQKLTEGSAVFFASAGKISKGLEVFYNPVMKLNRDVCILLLNSVKQSNLNIADVLAGSGIRSVRFAKELKKGKISCIHANDSSSKALNAIKKNARLNNVRHLVIHHNDANAFLLESHGFDYIDIDPFGSPNSFLDSAIKRLSRDGILGVTATDTPALTGTYELPCWRKYWAKPLRNELMHEVGTRILIRKIQLIGAQYEKALIPVFVHSSKHYFRVYLKCSKSKKDIDKIQKKHLFLLYCSKCRNFSISNYNRDLCCNKEMLWSGPLWAGKLWDESLVSAMKKNADSNNRELYGLISAINNECRINQVGFFDVHSLAKKYKFSIPKHDILMKRICSNGFKAAQTHFRLTGIRTDMPFKAFISIF